MIYLLLTILCTSLLFILFRWFSSKGINIFQTIVWNYVVCSITGCLMQLNTLNINLYLDHTDVVLWAGIMGCVFMPTFFLTGSSTRLAGIMPTTMANKLSMIIPAGFALVTGMVLWTSLHILAIALGIIAVYIVNNTKVTGTEANNKYIILPWIVFFSGGLLDLGLLYLNRYIITDETAGLFSIQVFVAAAFCGIIAMSIQVYIKKSFESKALFSGLLLGIPNYFSVYFLLKTLSSFHHDGSFVFPVLNLCVILLCTLSSVFLFREKISLHIISGLLIACSSIVLLYFTQL